MALVNFKKGLLANLPATKTAGTFYVTTDERAMYLDVDASTRIRLGDFQEFATVEALTNNANPNTSALYYVSDINCLAKWNGSEYIQINKDTGMTSVEVTGSGNAITAAVYDAAGRKLTLTKGATYMTAADVDGKISDKVGAIDGTVKAYVDEKTSGIASDAALTALTGRVATAESDIDALQAATAEGGAVTLAIADAKKAGTDAAAAAAAAQATADSKTTMADVEAKNYATKTEAQGYADAKDTAIAAAKKAGDDAQADVDALEVKVGTVPDGKTVVQMISDAQDAATYDDTALAGRVSTIEGDYLKGADKTALQANINAEASTARAAEKANADAIAKVKSDVDAFFAAAEVGEAAVDTLKEIQDYITTDGEAAATMTANIAANAKAISDEETRAKAAEQANANAISALETTVGDAESGLVKSVANNASAISAEKTRAEGAESALSGRIDTLEAIDHTAYALKTDVAADKTALQGNIDAVSARVKTIEDKNISAGANKVEASATNGSIKIDGVETVVYTHPAEHAISEVTGLQSALNAKAAQTSLDTTNANVTANANAITTLQNGKADKATTLAGYGITNAYTKTETYTQAEVDALLTWGSF